MITDPRILRVRALGAMLATLNQMKEEQRLLCAKLDGELVPADAPRAAKISCWRSLLLSMLEEQRPPSPAIEDDKADEDKAEGDEEDLVSPEELEKQRLIKERRLRTPEIVAQEESIASKLEEFGFVLPADGAVPVAAQLVEQHTLGGGGSTVRMKLLVVVGLVLILALVLDGIGVGASSDATAAFASAELSVGQTCTISGDTLGGMVRMGVASAVAVASFAFALSAVASRVSKVNTMKPEEHVAPCLPAWRPKIHAINRVAEKGIHVVICAHERHRTKVVLQNLGDSELRVQWAATDVEWARPIFPNDDLEERAVWPHSDLSFTHNLSAQVGSDGYAFAVVGTPSAKDLGAKYGHGELLHEIRVPSDEQRLDPKRNRLELGLTFQHHDVGDYTGTLLVHSNDPLMRYLEIPITLSVQLPRLRLDMNVIEATAPWNDWAEQRITVHNDGEAPLRIEYLNLDQADFVTTAYARRLDEPVENLVVEPHGPPALLTFRIEKSEPGEFGGTIALQTNDRSLSDSGISGRKEIPVELQVVKPELRADPPNLHFAVSRDGRASEIVTIYNDGGAAATITEMHVDADSRSWIEPMPGYQLPVTLQSRSKLDFGVRCVGPSDEVGGWERHAHLTMVTDDSRARAHKIPIALEVLLPRLRVEPREMLVAMDGTWEGSYQEDIELFNDGKAALTITDVLSELSWAEVTDKERESVFPLTLEPGDSRRVTASFYKPPKSPPPPPLRAEDGEPISDPEPEPEVEAMEEIGLDLSGLEADLEPEPEVVEELPPDRKWVAHKDAGTGTVYYHEEISGVTTWDEPEWPETFRTGLDLNDGSGYLSVACNDPSQKMLLLPVKMAVGAPTLRFDQQELSVQLRGAGSLVAGGAPAPYIERLILLTNEGDLDAKIQSLDVDRNSARWASVYFKDETTGDLLPASRLPAGYVLQPHGNSALQVTVRFEKPVTPLVQPRSMDAQPADASLPRLRDGELEHFVVPCPTVGCEETLTLNAQTDPRLRCRECQAEVSTLVDKIVVAGRGGDGVQVSLPGAGPLTSCRCPDPCGALVTFPIENTIFCPVCVEQVLEPTITSEGDAVVNAYSAPNATAGRAGVTRQEVPVPGGGVESSFLARHTDDLDALFDDPNAGDGAEALDGFKDDANEFAGFLEVRSNDPAKRMMQFPLKMALQAPLLRIEPSEIEVETTRGEQTSATLTLHNDGEGPLQLRNLEAVDKQGHALAWATPESSVLAVSERAMLAPGASMEVQVRFLSNAGGEHSGDLRLRSDSAGRGTVKVPLRLKVIAPQLKWEIEDKVEVAGQVSALWNSQAIDVPVPKDGFKSVILRIKAGSTAALRVHSVGSTAKWATLQLLSESGELVDRDTSTAATGSPFAHLLAVDQTLPGNFSASSSCAVRVDLSSRASDGAGVGEHTAQLAISSDDPAQATMVLDLRMKVHAPRLYIDKPLLNLDVGAGKDSFATFHVKNTGGAPLTIHKVTRSDGTTWATPHVGGLKSQEKGPWTLLPASDPLEVVVQVRQSQGGKDVGWLTVHSDDSVAPTRVVQINLKVDTPTLRVEPKTLTAARDAPSLPADGGDGSSPGGDVKKSLKLFNDGKTDLTVSTVMPDDECVDWCQVQSNAPLPIFIKPGAFTEFTVVLSSAAPEGATGAVLIGSNDGKLPSMAVPIVFKEPRLRVSREAIVARVGAASQCMLSMGGGSDTKTLGSERFDLKNEGQAPLVVRSVTVQDAPWASIHLAGLPRDPADPPPWMTIQPMSPSVEVLIKIDGSARRSAYHEGTVCISTSDPRGDVILPLRLVLAPLFGGICSPYPAMATNVDSASGKRLPKLVGGKCCRKVIASNSLIADVIAGASNKPVTRILSVSNNGQAALVIDEINATEGWVAIPDL